LKYIASLILFNNLSRIEMVIHVQ